MSLLWWTHVLLCKPGTAFCFSLGRQMALSMGETIEICTAHVFCIEAMRAIARDLKEHRLGLALSRLPRRLPIDVMKRVKTLYVLLA